jgi:hypothetical protein
MNTGFSMVLLVLLVAFKDTQSIFEMISGACQQKRDTNYLAKSLLLLLVVLAFFQFKLLLQRTVSADLWDGRN